MIRINKIEFSNYRQYKHISVSFPESSEYNLHVLRAKNGTGKTTFLNGILWCLYEHEHYLSNKDKALPVINDSLVEESSNNETLYVKVRITIYDDEKTLEFERVQPFYVAVDPLRKKKNAIGNQSKLTIVMTEKGKNSIVIEESNEVDSIVKQYFDEAIFDYYFFDGENLKSFFAKEKSKKIQESIFNISQVTLLKNASVHVNSMHVEKSRKASKIVESGNDYYSEQITLKETIDKLIKENEEIALNLPKWQQKVDDADSILLGHAPIKSNQEKRNSLEITLKRLKNEYNEFIERKNTFIREYLMYLSFYPRVKSTYDMIVRKEAEGNLPPNIDKEQVKKLLENHSKNCPVCNSVIDDKAILFLTELIDKLDVSSETSNYLMSIKATLENIIDKCLDYPTEKNTIIQSEKYYTTEMKKVELELDKISAFLSNYYDANTEKIDISKIEEERKYFRNLIINKTALKALNEREIKSNEDRLVQVEKLIEDLEARRNNKTLLNAQVALLRKINSIYDDIQKTIMDEMKKEIQQNTWRMFDSMIWKKNTFGSIGINNNYELTVYNLNQKEMTGSLSATEYMALAYAFTLAIHGASGKNCPLVVDSPLGRVSDENRANMASELLKVSKEKQIIMLFTPDEYSTEVSSIYDYNACSIRDIVLSEDESEVAKVGM